MGYFYAKRYQEERNRDPQLSWGYLSCQCFACAAALDNTLKEEIKAVYESILIAMRKKAMDTSDYDHYYNELQSYINEYIRPNNPWILYNLIHCESLCCPSKATLEKIIHVLDTEFTNSNANIYKAGALYIQFIRLYAELESELNMPGALIHLIALTTGPSD